MASSRPQILVLTGGTVDLSELRRVLGKVFDVVEVSPDEVPTTHRPGDLVLATQSDLESLLRKEVDPAIPEMLLNALGEGACLCDCEGHIVWSNERFGTLDEGSRDRATELCGQAARRYARQLASGRLAGELKRRRITVTPEGAERCLEISISPIVRGKQDNDVQVAAVIRDVTNRRRQLQKIEAINRAGQNLLHMDARLVREMQVADRLAALEQKVIRIAHELLRFDHFAVRLVNAETGTLDLVMATGLPEKAKAIRLRAELEGHGISGHVAATGRSYICNNAAADRRYVFGLEQAGSSLTVPLKLFDGVIGIFNVESNETEAFSESDRQFAEIFAQYLAMSLHILNLLLVERVSTRVSATGTFEGEVCEPLNDLAAEAEWLQELTGSDPAAAKHIERILEDVQSIRRRIQNVARGPQTLLGVDDESEESEIDPILQGKRVLVVDNEPVFREMIRNVLLKRGCEVVERESGETGVAALESAERTAAGGSPFDLVLSDINLGDRSGYDLFAAAKNLHTDLPVILMTGFGYDPHHSIVRASQEGLQCVLFKPFQVQRLLDEARKAIQQAESATDGKPAS